MTEKIVEYAEVGAEWPLTANILDPIRCVPVRLDACVFVLDACCRCAVPADDRWKELNSLQELSKFCCICLLKNQNS